MFRTLESFIGKAALFLFLLVMSQQASAWWNDKWPYRAPITLDTSITGANIESTQQDVPVLLRLHVGNFQDFFLLKENLADVRFVAMDDKTPLKHAVESFDIVNQMAFIWVRVPRLTASIATERFWMYYGNGDVPSSSDTAAVYDVNQVLALTFSPAESDIADRTAYATPLDIQGVTRESAGIIAQSAHFDGSQFITVQDTPAMRMVPDQGVTFSAWVKPVGSQIDSLLLHHASGASRLSLGINGNLLYAEVQNGGSVFATPRSVQVMPDTWQHVALILAKDNLKLLLNGETVASIPVQWGEMGGNTYLGASADGARGFVGELDEVRIDKVARSTDWIRAAALNQGMDDKLLTIQAAEQLGSGGSGSVFMVIGESIDEAGWTIIFLLGIMAAISWLVMLGKTFYINAVRRDNAAFMIQYRQLAGDDPAMLDAEESEDDKKLADSPIAQALLGKHDHFQSSPIYHLYHKVLQEVRGRLGTSVGAKAVALTPAAVASIRAMMDAEMTREMQKMNGQMVLLTIAISGGPFLGLLGTVVGVMVTFGTIAATGDVNIAAIAPGVAAALATTVAGLFVAIPALFGYNYIFSRIKETMVDMRVFGDEFVTRVAEYYGQE
jgi:biopolymer transport protein ExbB